MAIKSSISSDAEEAKASTVNSSLEKLKTKRTKTARSGRTRRSRLTRQDSIAAADTVEEVLGKQPDIEEAPTEFTTNEMASKTAKFTKNTPAKRLAAKEKAEAEAEEAQTASDDEVVDDDLEDVNDDDTWNSAEDLPSIPTIEEAAISLGKATKDEYIAANPEAFAQPTFVEITPAIAAQLFLRRAKQQRKVSREHVRFLSRQMSDGHWSFNGDTIRLNLKGELLDGQHRCLAVVDSGRMMNAVVVTVSDKSFETIDTGQRVRSVGELLRMNGEQNWPRLAAALSCMAEVEAGRKVYAAAGGKSRRSPLELQSVLEKHPDIRDSVQLCSKLPRSICPLAMYAAVHYLFWLHDAGGADDFFIDLAEGAGLAKTDPVFVLRERLMRDNMARAKATKFDKYSWFVHAWNARRRGEGLTRIKSSPIGEDPEIL